MAAAALLWPDRISGPFDGVPLDQVAEAVLVAGVVPALWYSHPRFLRTSRARACILALVVWSPLARGVHFVAIDGTMTGNGWAPADLRHGNGV